MRIHPFYLEEPGLTQGVDRITIAGRSYHLGTSDWNTYNPDFPEDLQRRAHGGDLASFAGNVTEYLLPKAPKQASLQCKSGAIAQVDFLATRGAVETVYSDRKRIPNTVLVFQIHDGEDAVKVTLTQGEQPLVDQLPKNPMVAEMAHRFDEAELGGLSWNFPLAYSERTLEWLTRHPIGGVLASCIELSNFAGGVMKQRDTELADMAFMMTGVDIETFPSNDHFNEGAHLRIHPQWGRQFRGHRFLDFEIELIRGTQTQGRWAYHLVGQQLGISTQSSISTRSSIATT